MPILKVIRKVMANLAVSKSSMSTIHVDSRYSILKGKESLKNSYYPHHGKNISTGLNSKLVGYKNYSNNFRTIKIDNINTKKKFDTMKMENKSKIIKSDKVKNLKKLNNSKSKNSNYKV
jgi:hypothetical protein